MSISRGRFLKSFGATLAGGAVSTGLAVATHLVGKLAAVSSSPPTPVPPQPTAPEIPFHRHGPVSGRRIALTFDDGPTPGVTDLILDELRARHLSATFFMIGQNAAAHPDLVRRVHAEGHEIGNHTTTHPRLSALGDSQVLDELRRTQEIVGGLTGHPPAWLRPPFGTLHRAQAALARDLGLGIVLWNLDPKDWSKPDAEHISRMLLEESQPGSIILCHDLHPPTAHCLGSVLDGLSERGFTFATVTALLTPVPAMPSDPE